MAFAFASFTPGAFLRFWVLPVAIGIALYGCAVKEPEPVSWDLAPEGQSVFYFLVLNSAAMQGDAETASFALEQLMRLDPSLQLYQEAVEFFLANRRWAEAEAAARKALVAYPDDFLLTLFHTESLLQTKGTDEALTTLAAYVDRHPEHYEAGRELARLLLINKEYARVLRILDRIPEADLGSSGRHLKARGLVGVERKAEAEKILRDIVKRDPEYVDARADLGVLLQSTGRGAEAIATYRAALRIDPENAAVWTRLLEAYVQAKTPMRAVQTLDEMKASSAVRLEAAAILLDGGSFKAAEKLLDGLRNLPDPPDEVWFYLAGLAVEAHKNPDEAIRLLGEVPENSHLYERAVRWQLQLLMEEGRDAQARALARQLAADHPNSRAYALIAAQVASETGKKEEAREMLAQARLKWPQDSLILYQLAAMNDATGRKDEAFVLMEELTRLEPDNAQALNYVGYTLAERGKDLDRALDLINRAVINSPEDPHIIDSLAWAQYQKGQYEEAWITIRRSLSHGVEHPVIWEHYGDIAARLGLDVEARRGYARALELQPENPEILLRKLKELGQ